MRIEGAEIERLVQQRAAAVGPTEPDVQHALRHGVLIRPERAPGPHVQRRDPRLEFRHVHHAVGNQRRGFDLAGALHLVDPDRPEIRDVLGADLIQLGKPLSVVCARVRQPRTRFLIGVAKALVRHLRKHALRAEQRRRRDRNELHGFLRRLARYAIKSSSS